MSATVAVLFVGADDEALAFGSALSDVASFDTTVVSTSDGIETIPDLDRLDCLVSADEAVPVDVDSADVTLPIVEYGTNLNGATAATVDRSADIEVLATTVVDVVTDEAAGGSDDSMEVNTLYRGSDVYYAVDEHWRITDWDPRMEDRTGMAPSEVLGERLWDAFPGAIDTEVTEMYTDVMESREPATFELYYDPLDYWAKVRAYPTDDGGVEFFTRDITERRERQQELRRANRTIDEAPVGITITDPDREDNPMIYVNDAFCELTGYDRESVIGRNCRFLQYEDTDPDTVAEMRRAIDAGEPVSVEILNCRADGTPFWNRIDIAPVRDETGDVTNFVGFQRDVTDTQQLEQRLRALHETTQELMVAGSDEEIGDVVVEAASEILDLPLTTLWRYNETDESFTAVARTDDAAATFDRSRLSVETDDEETLSARETPGWNAFQTGELQVSDDLYAQADGEPSIPVGSTIVAPLGEYGVLATAGMEPNEFDDRDVDLFRILATSTKAALAQAERELELQRQNERLDEFVSVVSHDLRNPLQVAISRLEAYQYTGDDVHLEHLERGHDRMQRLIDDMLMLARHGETVDEPEQVHLSTIARDAWEIAANSDAELAVATGTTLVADPDRLRRLFENLFRNAIEHAGEDVTVEIGTTTSGFYVADDGPGITPEDRDDAFEYGVTTSEDGTGFGLAIVKRIVDAHGWTIDIQDSERGGAQFDISGIATLARSD